MTYENSILCKYIRIFATTKLRTVKLSKMKGMLKHYFSDYSFESRHYIGAYICNEDLFFIELTIN